MVQGWDTGAGESCQGQPGLTNELEATHFKRLCPNKTRQARDGSRSLYFLCRRGERRQFKPETCLGRSYLKNRPANEKTDRVWWSMSSVLVCEGLSRAIQLRKDLPSMGMALMAQGSTLNKRGRRRKLSWIPMTHIKKHWDLEMGGSLACAGQLA